MKRRILSLGTAFALALTAAAFFAVSAAAAQPKLNKTSRTLVPGETYALKLSNAAASVTWSSSDSKVATVSKTGKVTAAANGKAVITAKSGGKSYKCAITVQRNRVKYAKSTIETGETLSCALLGKNTEKVKWSSADTKIASVSSKGVVTGKSAGKTKITVSFGTRTRSFTVTVKKAAKASASTLKGAYASIFGYVGTAAYTSGREAVSSLKNADALKSVKKHYNSITAENEMKPQALLSSVRITAAEAKKNGYVIPDGFKETHVPTINFGKIDDFLKIAADNNLSVRFHTLVWHSQTPDWFFKADYNNSGSYVSKAVMDKRMEMYIKTVIRHVYEGPYGDTVYAWDVVNEHLHNNGQGGWQKIYGDASYVASAFKYAHEELVSLKKRDTVSLFYNDYNTYEKTAAIISLIGEINKKGKYCDGVGMQSHLDVGYPSVSKIGSTIDAFAKEGYEIQITELDVTLNGAYYSGPKKSEADFAKYYGDLFKMLVEKKKGGANITGVTFWGIHDGVSWRGTYKPLLFSAPDKPKKDAFDAVINAAK
ncbi:MAG: endo-1,4-beta-xylanase [Oscillospiraceae bacterium]|jgi:GH35 family endo-1,4-beta-xylanase|nr:endo-1,4-beta-xylanase [Oscillospiraceae bacterium]